MNIYDKFSSSLSGELQKLKEFTTKGTVYVECAQYVSWLSVHLIFHFGLMLALE